VVVAAALDGLEVIAETQTHQLVADELAGGQAAAHMQTISRLIRALGGPSEKGWA
jgi:hypothetical protein